MFRHKHLSILSFACSLMATIVVACAPNSPIKKTEVNPSSPVNEPSPETICKTATKDPSGVVEVSSGVESSSEQSVDVLPSETPVEIGNHQKNRTQIVQPIQGWINSNQVSQVCKPKLTTQQVEILLQKAVDQTISDDYEDAIQALTEILWSQPDHAEAYYKRGIAFLNLSLLDYRGFLLQDQSPQTDLDKRFNQYYKVSFYNFEQATRLAPRSAEAFLYRGLTRDRNSTNYDESFTEAIRLNPNLAEAYYYRHQDRDLDKAISLNPNFAEAYYARFVYLPDGKSDYKDLLQALRLNPQFTESFEVFLDRQGVRPLLRRAPYPQLLLAKLNQRIQANPQDIDAYFGRGTLKLELADRNGAIADFTRVIQANSKDADAYYNRGLARYRIKDYPGAVADIRQALKLNAKMQEPYAILSLVYYDMGNQSAALKNATQAIQLNSTQIIPYLVQGLIYTDQGKVTQANASFNLIGDRIPTTGHGSGSSVPTQDHQAYKSRDRALAAQGRKQGSNKSRRRANTSGR
jgi:tetratricopeptide (TPR) repeat protein